MNGLTKGEIRTLYEIRGSMNAFMRTRDLPYLAKAEYVAAKWINRNKQRRAKRVSACQTIKFLFAGIGGSS